MAAAVLAAKTASTHRAALVQGTHQLDMVGYGALKAKAAGRRHSVTSGSFRVAGHDWAVVCGFDGGPPAAGLLADVSLELLASAADGSGGGGAVTATASFTIEDPTGAVKPMQIGDGGEATTMQMIQIGNGGCKHPIPPAFRRLESRYVRDDRLRIRCTVRVLVEDEVSRPARYCFVAAPAPPDMAVTLAALLESGRRADVTFAVEASTFEAHRVVLAMRSPVFRAKFFGDSRDSRLGWFRVHDVRAPVFKAMLHFIYTDELPCFPTTSSSSNSSLDDGEMAGDLLVAADLYDLERLRVACESMLWESVISKEGTGTATGGGASTALSVLLRVKGRHSCRQLEDLCVGYLAGVWDAATATEEYRELKASCPAALNDILEKVVGAATTATTAPATEKSASASTYRSSDAWRGSHEFTILGHSGVRRTHGNGEFICSGSFEVGGHEWRILYYPSGYDGKGADHVTVLLKLVTSSSCVGGVLEVSGTLTLGNTSDDFCHDFTHGDTQHGVFEMATVDDVTSTHVGPDDSLTIECLFEFGIRAATTTTSAAAREIVVPPPNMPWHLERLLEAAGELGADVTFVVDSSLFHAHSLLVSARAPALLEQAQADEDDEKKKKRKKKVVVIAPGIKAVVFKALLHFVYTDELPPLDDLVHVVADDGKPSSWARSRTWMAGDLLAAAERYQLLERMRPLCENLVCEVMTLENAAAALEVARRHNRPDLKAFCLDYMSTPGVLRAVQDTDAYKDLSADALGDILHHLAATASSS